MQASIPCPQAVANQDKGPAVAQVAKRGGTVDNPKCPEGEKPARWRFGTLLGPAFIAVSMSAPMQRGIEKAFLAFQTFIFPFVEQDGKERD